MLSIIWRCCLIDRPRFRYTPLEYKMARLLYPIAWVLVRIPALGIALSSAGLNHALKDTEKRLRKKIKLEADGSDDL